MVHKLLAVTALLFATNVAVAQEPPPPRLDDPQYWEIHGPNGDLGFTFQAEFLIYNGTAEVWLIHITGVVNGEPYYNFAIAYDESLVGEDLSVYNNDSKQWTTWEWEGDHYTKVGGTKYPRTYHPVN